MSRADEVWTSAQVREAEQRAIAAGVGASALMEAAGQAAARTLLRSGRAAPALVLCGTGNNGGDGYVVARALAEAGVDVRVVATGEPATETARAARLAWAGSVETPTMDFERPAVIVDALFGIGLSRAPESAVRRLIEAANASPARIVALDIPSGVDADTGETPGVAIRADQTIVFHRRKSGHVLLPGAANAGTIDVVEIGLPEDAAGQVSHLNRPTEGWRALVESPRAAHKYSHGHTLVVGGGAEGIGAARLAARAALRSGSGLVTIAAPADAFAAHIARGPDALIVKRAEGSDALRELLHDERRNALVIGPALGHGPVAHAAIDVVLRTGRRAVLDADALTAFEGRAAVLADIIGRSGARVVMTPHTGEFAKLFDGTDVVSPRSRIEQARAAAKLVGAVVVLKGADTVVAHPDGRAVVNDNAPAWLATAGSGDVLCGIIAAGLARSLGPFEAASAGVWLHGAAGAASGRGLIADDLPEALPQALAKLARTLDPSAAGDGL